MEYEALHGIVWHKGTFWVTIAVLIFVAFFGRKLIGAVIGMLDKRSADIQQALDEAAKLRTEAEAMLKDAEAKRQEALVQAKEMLALASREAERLSAELLADAEQAARRHEQMAKERIAAAETAAVTEVRTIAATMAGRAAEVILRETIDGRHDHDLIDQAIAGLPAALSRKAA